MPYSNEQENVGALGTDVDVNEIAPTTLVTESETISSNDNDTTIPTSAAVKNYADAETATLTNKDISAANNTYRSASDSVSGAVELATAAETTTGTDATRAVTPDGLAGSDFGIRFVQVLVLDNTTAATVTDEAGDFYYTVPEQFNGYNLVVAHASVGDTGTTGTMDIQIHNVTDAVDMLSTKITIDSGEATSYTAATPPVINTSNDDVATGDQLRFDIDAIHSGTAANGLNIILGFQLP
jgi:hypothetical protein